jgi:hypothetical protein
VKKIIFIAFLVCTINTYAQQSNFTGIWQINKTKTNFGQAPEWVLPRYLKVSGTADKLIIERTMLSTELAEQNYTESFPMNGQPGVTTTTTGKKETGTIQKTDNGLNLSFINEKPDGSLYVRINEQWSLENAGQTLVIDRFVDVPDGIKYEIKAYYDKK